MAVGFAVEGKLIGRRQFPVHVALVYLDKADISEDVGRCVGKTLQQLILQPLQLHFVAIRRLRPRNAEAGTAGGYKVVHYLEYVLTKTNASTRCMD